MLQRIRWAGHVAAGATLLVVTTGCVDNPDDSDATEQTAPATTEAPTNTAITESARAVYETYLDTVEAMYAEADDDYTRLLNWATVEMATLESAGIADLTADGVSVTDWFAIVEFHEARPNGDIISVPACVDVSQVVLTAADGSDATPPDREALVPLSLRFEVRDETLLLDAQDPWDPAEESPCSS